MTQQQRILARARKALLSDRVEDGRKLFWLVQELRSVRYGPEHVRKA